MAFSLYRRPVLERRNIMSHLSWLRSPTPNGGSKIRWSRQPATGFRPRLEVLEDRWLPSQIGLTVNSLADSGPGSLRAAIQAADAGSPSDNFTISFAVKGTIDLQSPLPDLNNTIAIKGPGPSSLTVERATGASFGKAIVTVDAGQTASLSGLTVANGNAGGIDNYGTLTVAKSAVLNNSARRGAGIENEAGGTLTITGSTVSGNSATFGAAGIENEAGGTLTITGSTVSGNSATFGGGVGNLGTLTVRDSTVSGNSAAFDGGGILNGIDATATVSSTTLSGNTAISFGAGIVNVGTLTIRDSSLSSNSTTGGDAGGIDNIGWLTVSNSTVSDNSCVGGEGGGIDNVSGTLTVANSIFSGNSAYEGGAIFSSGVVTLRDSVLTANSATEGGGIYNTAFGTLDVRGSIFTDNTASDSGGGLYNLGTATIQECILWRNAAGSAGGGIFNSSSGTLAVKDSLVLNNVAPLGADLYNLGALTLDDSTVGVIGP
jgi:predicted outer membrane repeat protein